MLQKQARLLLSQCPLERLLRVDSTPQRVKTLVNPRLLKSHCPCENLLENLLNLQLHLHILETLSENQYFSCCPAELQNGLRVKRRGLVATFSVAIGSSWT